MPTEEERVRQALQDLARRLRETAAASPPDPAPLTELPREPFERQRVRDLEQDIELKKKYANTLLVAMLFQLGIADAVFIIYAWIGVDWQLSSTVINVWLVGTLVEVIGIVLVVTRYLFPRRDSQGDLA